MEQVGARRARRACKKKELKPKGSKGNPDLSEDSAPDSYRSIFDHRSSFYIPTEPRFFPPEAFGLSEDFQEDPGFDILEYSRGWDLATRYHEFKSKPISSKLKKHLRKMSAEAILERAQEVLGSVVHPMVSYTSPMTELPPAAEQVDFDLDETLDFAPLVAKSIIDQSLKYPLSQSDIWMTYSVRRSQPLILTVDTSLSMTGEKLALTAVALAVVLLEFAEDPIGIVAFENEARVLKRPDERISIELFVERFLDVPAQGYTHLEEGMREALILLRKSYFAGSGRPPSTVLLTDGKYTAGKDPIYLAPRFPHLVVLKMGKEKAGQELCRDLAKKGHGVIREVPELEALPGVMYGVVKDLLRGRSLA